MTDRNITIKKASMQVKNNRAYTTDSFITKAKSVHGNKYIYSKTQYIKSSLKVTITCKAHGDFNQEAASHIRGYGCPTCARVNVGIKNAMRFSDFLERAALVHRGRYSYDESTYMNQTSLVKITCKIHGAFKQKGNEHLKGRACPRCAGFNKDTKEFVRQARLTHGDRYNYEKTEYTNYYTDLLIECPEHGQFEQNPRNHLSGSGCHECSKELNCGFDRLSFERICKKGKSEPMLYIIECFDDCERFYKIGITSKALEKRFYPSCLPYKYKALFEFKGDPLNIFDLERSVHKILKKCKYQPKKKFGGCTECFSSIELVVPLFKKLTTGNQPLLIT